MEKLKKEVEELRTQIACYDALLFGQKRHGFIFRFLYKILVKLSSTP